MHRLRALRGYWRAVEVERDRRVAVLERKRVRRSSVHREIGCLNSCRIHRVAQIDDEIRRLRVDDAVASRDRGGHGKADQLPVGKGVLLGLAADNVAPVHPMKTCAW